MNVTVENLAPCKKLLRVEVEAEKVEAAFEEVMREFQREAKLPGFRPGKAPKEMILKRFESGIKEEVKRKLLSESYREAVAKEKLDVIGRPDIEEIQFERGQALQFVATMETAPVFELPSYKGLPARRDGTTVGPQDIQQALDLLRQRAATFVTVARELRAGDYAVVNYTGTCEGKPISQTAPAAKGLTEKKNFWMAVEEDSFIPGFTKQLIGMKAGERRTVSTDFPAAFPTPQLAGKKGIYEVELVEVKEKVLPELNDAFAQSLHAQDLESLRQGVRADLQNELNLKQNQSIREQVTRALLNQVRLDLPESVVERDTRALVYGIVQENQQRGISKETLDAQKEQIYSKAHAAAMERVKAAFVFRKIAEAEGTRVSEEEITARLHTMADQYKMPMDKLAKEMEKSGGLADLCTEILHEKVVNLLVQFARIEDAPAPRV